jgi:hypothetical protein
LVRRRDELDKKLGSEREARGKGNDAHGDDELV